MTQSFPQKVDLILLVGLYIDDFSQFLPLNFQPNCDYYGPFNLDDDHTTVDHRPEHEFTETYCDSYPGGFMFMDQFWQDEYKTQWQMKLYFHLSLLKSESFHSGVCTPDGAWSLLSLPCYHYIS